MSGRADPARVPVRKRHLSQPCLILIMGVAGSGKTALAREILRRLWAVYLDNNHIVDAFFPDTRSGKNYERLRPRFYQILYAIAEANLRLGNSILLDVPHIKEVQVAKWRRFIKGIATRTRSKIIVIRCFCSERTLHARLHARREKRDDWKFLHWKEFLTQQPIKTPVPFSHLDIDTEKNLAANTRAAVRYILQSA
jgi:predicted kinase